MSWRIQGSGIRNQGSERAGVSGGGALGAGMDCRRFGSVNVAALRIRGIHLAPHQRWSVLRHPIGARRAATLNADISDS